MSSIRVGIASLSSSEQTCAISLRAASVSGCANVIPSCSLDSTCHPSVGVRLSNVDEEEFDLIAEVAMERFKVPSLGTERRSGVAAEDERDRLAPAKGRQPHLLGAV